MTEVQPEKCQRCGEEGHDCRTLWMACFYDMSEFNVPFEEVCIHDREFYTLRVCKECRADWLQVIEAWFNSPPELIMVSEEVQVRRNIPVRIAGAIQMMSEEEYEAYHHKEED